MSNRCGEEGGEQPPEQGLLASSAHRQEATASTNLLASWGVVGSSKNLPGGPLLPAPSTRPFQWLGTGWKSTPTLPLILPNSKSSQLKDRYLFVLFFWIKHFIFLSCLRWLLFPLSSLPLPRLLPASVPAVKDGSWAAFCSL